MLYLERQVLFFIRTERGSVVDGSGLLVFYVNSALLGEPVWNDNESHA